MSEKFANNPTIEVKFINELEKQSNQIQKNIGPINQADISAEIRQAISRPATPITDHNIPKETNIREDKPEFSIAKFLAGVLLAPFAASAAIVNGFAMAFQQGAGLTTAMANSQAKSEYLKDLQGFLQKNETLKNGFLHCCNAMFEGPFTAIDNNFELGFGHFMKWAEKESIFSTTEQDLKPRT